MEFNFFIISDIFIDVFSDVISFLESYSWVLLVVIILAFYYWGSKSILKILNGYDNRKKINQLIILLILFTISMLLFAFLSMKISTGIVYLEKATSTKPSYIDLRNLSYIINCIFWIFIILHKKKK